MSQIRSGRRKIATLVACAAIAVVFIKLSRPTSSPEPRRAARPSLSVLACAKLCGVESDGLPTFEGASLSDVADYWRSLGCKTEFENVQPALPNRFPVWCVTNNGVQLIVASDVETSQVYAANENLEWLAWGDLTGALASKQLLYVSGRRKTVNPKLVTLDDSVYLGSLEKESGISEVQRLVPVFNVGDAPVTVLQQKFSCTCATAVLRDTVIPPGGSSVALVKMDLSRATARSVQWFIACDPPSASLTTNVSARGATKVRLSPDYFSFGSVRPSQSSFTVQTAVSCTAPKGRISVEPVYLTDGLSVLEIDAGETTAVVKFSVNALEAPRDTDGRWTVEAVLAVEGCGGKRELHSITGKGWHIPEIQVRPEVINAGTLSAGESVTRTVTFSTSGEHQTIGKVSVAHPELIQAQVVGSAVRVTVHAPEKPGFFKTGILLEVDGEHVNIPVLGLVSD